MYVLVWGLFTYTWHVKKYVCIPSATNALFNLSSIPPKPNHVPLFALKLKPPPGRKQ